MPGVFIRKNIIYIFAVKNFSCICDLDLFTAVITETALIDRPDIKSTSLLGELLNHIMSDMFGRLRCGDRFWYEFDAAGFTESKSIASTFQSILMNANAFFIFFNCMYLFTD